MENGSWNGGSTEERYALLHLRSLPGISDRRIGELLARYGSACATLEAPASELGEAAVAARGSVQVLGRVERAMKVIDQLGAIVLTRSDPRYPVRLHDLHDPPPVLFARGRLELLKLPAVAIVGARRHTPYGREVATALGGGLARAGVVVVSGMARGIDAAAHAAALEGGTIGVLGSGLDVVYPREHTALYERVGTEGLLLSEFMPGEPALRYHFPRRNRLIAALSRGVVVVEASEKSGSLITVEHALDLGREVFAVPGPIGRDTSIGTNRLIQDGAKLVLGIGDILEELGVKPPAEAMDRAGPWAAPPGLDATDLGIWQALADGPRHVDELSAITGLSAPVTLARLLKLELEGKIRQIAGARFIREGKGAPV